VFRRAGYRGEQEYSENLWQSWGLVRYSGRKGLKILQHGWRKGRKSFDTIRKTTNTFLVLQKKGTLKTSCRNGSAREAVGRYQVGRGGIDVFL